MTNIKKPASEIKVGDVIMPPARELSLWMRKTAKDRGLDDAALHLTVIEVYEGAPDAKGRWFVVSASYSAQWATNRSPIPTMTFRVRPETAMVLIAEGVAA